MLLHSPLEQFELTVLFRLNIFGLDLSFITMSFFLVLGFICLISLFMFAIYNVSIVPSSCQTLLELIYKFIFGILAQQVGLTGQNYFPLIFFTFCFVLISNLLGLIPFCFTTTSHIMITLAMAFSFNLGYIYIGFYRNSFKFLNVFVPSGVPKVLLPLVVVLEVISYLLRVVSMSVRLFANMFAGHTLLHILMSAVVAFFNSNVFIKVVAILPFLVVLAVYLLEIAISFIQAYVFATLLCIYLNDSIHPGH